MSIGLDCSFPLVFRISRIVMDFGWCTVASCTHLIACWASRIGGGLLVCFPTICGSDLCLWTRRCLSLRWEQLQKEESEVGHVSEK